MADSEKSDRQHEEDEKKSKFKVIDKRRINFDEVEASEAESEPLEKKKAPEPAPEAEIKAPPEPADGRKEGMKFKFAPGVDKPTPPPELTPEEDPLAFSNVLLNIMQTAATVALIDLGLVPHPQTNLIVKKLEEARKAIDLFELLLKQFGKDIPEQIRVEFVRALQDLKAGYVSQL